MSVPSLPKDQFLALKQLWQSKLTVEEKIKSLEAICNIQGNMKSILENLTKEFRAIPGSSISDTTGGSTVVDPATINHELLGGLLGGATNDHYHLTAVELSALHPAVTVVDSASVDLTISGQTLTAAVLPAGVDHNSLANLATGDPHTQYTENSGSITQLTTRNHNDLQNINGGADLQHMTAAQITALHARSHAIDATADHTSAITAGKGLMANANGLPTGSAHIAENATGVGIGTVTPAEKLDVDGNIKSNSGFILNGGTKQYRLLESSGELRFTRYTTADVYEAIAARILSTGDFGVGGSPVERLYAYKAAVCKVLIETDSGGIAALKLMENTAGVSYGFEFLYDGSVDKLFLWTRSFAGAEFVRMVFLKTGAVCIGVNDPTDKLCVEGNFDLTTGGVIKISGVDKSTDWTAAKTHADNTSTPVHGSTTVGYALFKLTNPSAIRFLRVNADNTVTALSDADFKAAIGIKKLDNDINWTTSLNSGKLTDYTDIALPQVGGSAAMSGEAIVTCFGDDATTIIKQRYRVVWMNSYVTVTPEFDPTQTFPDWGVAFSIVSGALRITASDSTIGVGVTVTVDVKGVFKDYCNWDFI